LAVKKASGSNWDIGSGQKVETSSISTLRSLMRKWSPSCVSIGGFDHAWVDEDCIGGEGRDVLKQWILNGDVWGTSL